MAFSLSTPLLLSPLPLRRRVTTLKATSTDHSSIFTPATKVSAPETLITAVPTPVRQLGSLALTAASVVGGYELGLRVLQTRGAAIGGAAVIGAIGGEVVYKLNKGVPKVAAQRVRDLVWRTGDGRGLEKGEVEEILRRYGVSRNDDVIRAEFSELYSCFISSVIPPGVEELTGNEAETIIKFKEALGVDDSDAASAHMEMGRRIFRERLESGNPEANAVQNRLFQRLIYVSTLVFGEEASKFLLPWKRIFKVTDAQVDLAIRDNAQRLYALKLKSLSKGIEETRLIDLRKSQLLYRLSDKIAAEMFREHTRILVEENISAALDLSKSSINATTGTTGVIEELEKVLAFNSLLTQLEEHSEAERFALGVGPVRLSGGKYDPQTKMDALKHLYKAYAADCFPNGRIELQKFVALSKLEEIFGLGVQEAKDIALDIKSKIYRKRLSQVFSSGDLAEASSKAEFLENLCDELLFDAEKASKIHGEIYRQKLKQCLADGELDGVDVAALRRLRVLLCISQETVDATHADICGPIFEEVVKNALACGLEGYDDDAKTLLQTGPQGLQLTENVTMAIVSKAVRKAFMSHIQLARNCSDSTEAAKELKKLIMFNSLLVTELMSDIKGEVTKSVESLNEKSEEIDKYADELEESDDINTDEDELESLQTLRKTRPNAKLQEQLAKPSQTEINLKDDLPQKDRAELYKIYLLFCVSGEATRVPLGAEITTKKDDTEYLLLNQLSEILGLTRHEIFDIHRTLAEQAFAKEAEVILADGQLTPERNQQLIEAQIKVGLPQKYAQKLITKITTQKLSAAIETAASQGRIGIKQVREMREENIDLNNMISEGLRESLYKKVVDEIFSSGTCDFDEEEVYVKLPQDLSINAENAKKVAQELAKSMLTNSLVQAVASLRQNNRDGVVASLNNMLVCDMAVPAEQPLTWSSPVELTSLYMIYLKTTQSPCMILRLQHLLGIDDSTAEVLLSAAMRDSTSVEEEAAFVF